jgi:hypothetical protein
LGNFFAKLSKAQNWEKKKRKKTRYSIHQSLNVSTQNTFQIHINSQIKFALYHNLKGFANKNLLTNSHSFHLSFLSLL